MRVARMLFLVVVVSLAAAVTRGSEPVSGSTPSTKEAEARRWAWIRNSMFAARYDRVAALALGGGSDRTEYAVILALRWLKTHQNADGSWGEDPLKPTMTGFALMCFLGHGEDHTSAEFGATVRNGVGWLVHVQDEEGFFTKQYRYAYQHAIATIAMAEAYGQMRIDDLQPVVERAVARICAGQTEEGGWYYGYMNKLPGGTDRETGREHPSRKWKGGDTSVSGWQIQALTAAWWAGIRLPNNALRNARSKALQDVKSRVNVAEGWSGYHETSPVMLGDNADEKRANAYTLTGVATVCLQFLGDGRGPAARSMLNTMKQYTLSWQQSPGGWQNSPLYAWYYITQATLHSSERRPADNRHWVRWNRMMTAELLRWQNSDGSWGFPAKSKEGTEHVKGEQNKPVYATALCCLMLEVYYRYAAGLPAYKRGAASR